MSKHEIGELHQLQALPLNEKVKRTKVRIKQWVEYWGLDHVYVSFSGGKDSTVLLNMARQMYPDIKAVFLDTSLEFPELRQFVASFENVEYLKPQMNFRQVIEKYGYPLISKEVSECAMGARIYLAKLLQEKDSPSAEHTNAPYQYYYNKVTGQGKYQKKTNITSVDHYELYQNSSIPETKGGYDNKYRRLCGLGLYSKNSGTKIKDEWLSMLTGTDDETFDIELKDDAVMPSNDRSAYSQERYKFLLEAPFNVSNRCCNVFKKNLSHSYNRKNDMHPILGSMASESRLRTQKWLDNGCNGFDLKEPVSNPMSFWTDGDVLLYIKENNLPVCSVYGDIVTDYKGQNQVEGQISFADIGLFDDKPILTTTGCLRTGCIGCGFGLLLEKRPNRLEMIDKVSNPKLRDFILRGGAFDDDGLWKPDDRGLGFWFVHKYTALALRKNLYIPEYERYEREYGNEMTRQYLERIRG